jgi:hypothetical protein
VEYPGFQGRKLVRFHKHHQRTVASPQKTHGGPGAPGSWRVQGGALHSFPFP